MRVDGELVQRPHRVEELAEARPQPHPVRPARDVAQGYDALDT